MSTSRNTLHKTKLDEFTEFCTRCGWIKEPCKGDFEVLRMRRDGNKDPLLVYTKMDAKEHYTTHGVAEIMLHNFINERRNKS